MNNQEWLERLNQANNMQEWIAMFMQATEPAFEKFRARAATWASVGQFSSEQEDDLRRAAAEIMEREKWEALPWRDANNGAYALAPSEKEILAKVSELKTAYREILKQGGHHPDYGWEVFFWFENLPSLNFWKTSVLDAGVPPGRVT